MILGLFKWIRSLDKKILLFVTSQISQYVSSFIIIKLLASRLSVPNFGLYNLVITTCFVIGMLPFTAFDQILNRKISTIPKNKLNIAPFLMVYFFFIVVIHAVFIGSYFFLPDRLQPAVLVIVGYSISNISKTTLCGILNFTDDRTGFNNIKVFDNVLKVAFICLFFGQANINLIFLGLITQNLIVLIIWTFYYRRYINFNNIFKNKYKPYIRYLGLSSIPLLIWAPFELIQNNLYIYFLEYNHYRNEVGYFSFYNSLSLVIPAGVAGILSSYMLPKIYGMVRTNSFGDVSKHTIKVLLIYLFVSIGAYGLLAIVLKGMVQYLSKSDYLNRMDVFNYFYAANLVFNGSIIVTNIFFAYKMQRLLIPVKVIPGLIAFVILLMFAPHYGLDAVKYTFVTVSVIQILIVYIAYSRLKFKLNGHS